MTTDPCACETICSLPADELEARAAMVRAEILPLVRRRVTLPDGLAWEFEVGATMQARLERFVELERRCCSGLAFDVAEHPETGTLRLSVRGDGAAAFAALGEPVASIRSTPVAGGRLRAAVTAGGVGALASLLLCCGLPLALASVAGAAVAAPLARLDHPGIIGLGALVLALPVWLVMQHRGRARGAECGPGC